MLKRSIFLIPLALIVGASFLRLIPHAPNFTPILSIALFAGATLTRKRYALAVPILAMLLSDAIIGFHSLVPVIYASMLLIVALGMYLSKHMRLASIVGFSILASTLFFVISNFAVWILTPYYSKDLLGLASCFTAALPFYGNSLISTLLYSSLLFGLRSTLLRLSGRLAAI